jgi:hypothetical protein
MWLIIRKPIVHAEIARGLDMLLRDVRLGAVGGDAD